MAKVSMLKKWDTIIPIKSTDVYLGILTCFVARLSNRYFTVAEMLLFIKEYKPNITSFPIHRMKYQSINYHRKKYFGGH